MAKGHALEEQFGLSASEILEVIARNNRLLVAVKGGIAQEHLRRYLQRLAEREEIRDFRQIDQDGMPDFEIIFEGDSYLVECKNVQKTMRNSEVTVDFMRTRYAKTQGPEGRFYAPSEFQVLAACLYNQTGRWDFRFISTSKLSRHPDHPDRLESKVSLGPSKPYFEHWTEDLVMALRSTGRP